MKAFYRPYEVTLYNYDDDDVNAQEITYNRLQKLPSVGHDRNYEIDPSESISKPYEDAYLGVRQGFEGIAYYSAGGETPLNKKYYLPLERETTYGIPNFVGSNQAVAYPNINMGEVKVGIKFV